MARIKVTRKAKLDGNKAVIVSDVVERMGFKEYEKLYIKKSKTKHALDFAIRDAKGRLEMNLTMSLLIISALGRIIALRRDFSVSR